MKRLLTHHRRRQEPAPGQTTALDAMDWLTFPPLPGAPASSAPPVRIFLGTEPAHYRAERVFVWSVLQHRDPARCYEIALMKHLPGFDRSRWTTGFSNYRFAIPALAGARGRAIYNDVDQIYLADPALLFDTDMEGHGYLALSPEDTSVMLLDCSAMAPVWSLESARRESKHSLLERAATTPGLFGSLDASWNARDEEYAAAESRLLHYTALHLQPWSPEPAHFSYRMHPHADLWDALERSADEAGFTLFDRAHPSHRYQELINQSANLHTRGTADNRSAEQTFPGKVLSQHLVSIRELVANTNAHSVLDYGAGKASLYKTLPGRGPDDPLKAMPAWGEDVQVTVFDPAYEPYSRLPDAQFDGVVCTDVLEHISEQDIPWVLQEIFSRAQSFVYVSVACYPAKKTLANGENAHVSIKPPAWWEQQFRSAARRYPGVYWTLSIRVRNWRRKKVRMIRRGGHWPRPPRVWVLADDRPGNRNQAIALADSLGYEYEVKPLRYNLVASMHNALLGASRAGLTRACAADLTAPWPDLVVAAGRRTAPVARWIKERANGATRLIQMGRKGGDVAEAFDAVITPLHCRLPFHPRRIETLVPFSPMALDQTVSTPAGASALTVALIGGATRRHRFGEREVSDLIAAIKRDHQATGGELCIVTSVRTGADATEQIRTALSGEALILTPSEMGDRYWATLRSAQRVIVTGESESFLADAVSTGRPVFIHALPMIPLGRLQRIGAWLEQRATLRPQNRRATTRPQRGLEYLCARLVEKGWLRPLRDLELLHQTLYARGLAAPFGSVPPPAIGTPAEGPSRLDDETALVIARARELVAMT